MCAAAAWAAVGCDASGDPRGEPVLRIGILALFDGMKTDGSGLPTVEGARMAAADLNASGGVEIGGVPHRVEVVERRHPFRVEGVTTAARSLINRDSVHALVGPQYSQHAIPVGAIAERAGVPMISPMSSSPATTRGREYVFRIAYLDADQGRAMALFAREDLGLRRVAVVRSLTNPYSTDVADRFVEVFRELGGEVVESSFPGGGREVIRGAFREVLRSRPERVFLPLQTEEVVEILELVDEEGLGIGVLGTDSWDTALLQGLPAAQDAYVALQWMWSMPDPGTVEFSDRYREAHGEPPRSTAALSYDAVRILATGARAAGSLEGSKLATAITELPVYEGVSGPIHFAGTHDPVRPVVVSRIVDARMTFVKTIEVP